MRYLPDGRSQKGGALRLFAASAAVASCVIMIVLGFILADYHTRRMAQGGGDMRTDAYYADGSVYIQYMGQEYLLSLPEELTAAGHFLRDCLPPGWQAGAGLFELGSCAAEQAADAALGPDAGEGTNESAAQ